MRIVSSAALIAGAILGLGTAPASGSAASGNPFENEAVSAPVAPANPELEALELTGIVLVGGERSFSFLDRRTKKSFWLAEKQQENGFSVVSYDAGARTVRVSSGNASRDIPLRLPSIVAAATPPAAAPKTPTPRANDGGVDEIANPKTPAEIKQAEMEARMMVSDLLEISMRERQRQRELREAQRRGQAPAAHP